MVANRGTIPLAELRSERRKKLTASRSEIVNAVKPAKTIEHKGRVTRTATKSTLLDSLGLGDYTSASDFNPYSGSYGSSGIYTGQGTSEYTQDLMGMTRPKPDYPAWMDLWNATPGPVKWGLKTAGGPFLNALEALAIPLSAVAASMENIYLVGYNQLDPEGMRNNPTALAAYDDLWEMANDPNLLKAIGKFSYDTLWDRRKSGSHDFMYGQGDIFNTFNIWQGERGTDQEWEWWANRGAALLGDLRMDPLMLGKTFGTLSKSIARNMQTGDSAIKLGRTYTAQKLDDVLRPLFKRELGAGGGVAKAAPKVARQSTLAQKQTALRVAERGAKAALNPKTRENYQKLADRLRREIAGGPAGPPAGHTLQVAEERVVGEGAERIYQFWDEMGTPFTVTWRGAEVLDKFGQMRPTKAADLEIAVHRVARQAQPHVPNARPTHPSQTTRGGIGNDTVIDGDLFSAAGRRAAALVMEAELGATRRVAERLAPKAVDDAAAMTSVWQEAVMNRMSDKQFVLQVARDLSKGTSQIVVREGDRTFINFGAKFGQHRKVAETVGNKILKVEIPKNVADDIGRLADYLMISSREGPLKLTNEGYKFAAKAMHEVGMDPFFNLGPRTLLNGVKVPAETGFRTAGTTFRAGRVGKEALDGAATLAPVTASEAAHAGFRIGLAVPFTGSMGRKLLVNPVRKRLLGMMALPDAVPMLAWSASNKYLGRPLVAANNFMRKAFVGRGNRYSKMGGKTGEFRKTIRKSKDPWEVIDAKAAILAVGRGSQMTRSAEQLLHRMFQDVKDAIQTHPRLARDHPDGGAVLQRAVWGNEDAVQIVREAAGDELFDQFISLLPRMADELEIKAGRKFIGRANNYGPRKISKEAREHMSKRRPGSVRKRHQRKPYDAGPHELERKYVDQDEFAALVQKYIREGMEPEAAIEQVAKIKSDEIFGQKLFKVNTIMDDGMKAPSVEEQIAKIMDDMDIGYSLFVEDWYEVMPSYVTGMAKRAGEVFTEHLLVDKHGLFMDRMSTMAQVPSTHVQGRWTMVMRAQLNLKHQAAAVSETLSKIAKAGKSEMKQLEMQLVRRNAVLDLAEETYEKAAKTFDVEALAVQRAEAHAMIVRNEVEALQTRIGEITNGLKRGDVGNAVLLEQERVKLAERIATLQADPSVPKYYLESLRASTIGQLEMEHRIHDVFRNIETFEAFEKIFKRWDPALPLTKTNLYDFMVKNQDQAGLVGNLDIIPDVKQFILRLGKEGVKNEYDNKKVLEMLKGSNKMLDDLDSTPLGSWLGVETSPAQQADTLSGLRLQQYSQVYKSIKQHTQKSTKILQEWVTFHPAVWKGKIPTPANVEEARVALVKFTDDALKQGQTFGDAMAQIGAESTLRQHLHTYYGVHNDLNMMNMTNFGTIDNIVDQMETAIRLRYHDIEKALAEFRPVTFQIRVGPGEHGVRTLGIEEYAKYQRLKEAALQSRYSAQVPLPPAQYTIDDILAGGSQMARNGSGQGGVVGGTHPGGKYLVNTPTGPKEFYVKQYGADRETLAALQRESDDVAEFINTGLFHEAGDLPEGTDYRAHFGPMLERYKAGDGPQAFVHDHLISDEVRDQAMSHLDMLDAQIGKQAVFGKLRAEGEVLANALYREVGGDVATAPISYASYSKNTASWWVVSEWMDGLMPVGRAAGVGSQAEALTARMHMAGGGLPRVITAQQATALGPDAASNIRPIFDMLGDNYLTDVLLANWTVLGDDVEKIALNQSGRLVRVDNGGVFRFQNQGGVKPDTWDYRVVDELYGFLDPEKATSGYGVMAESWENALGGREGAVAALQSQFVQLDDVRKSYGGWQGFVRKHLPDIQSSGEKEYASFLEHRYEVIANKLGEKYNTGIELAAEALSLRGVPTPEIEKALNRFGPTQAASKKSGFRPWLSPDGSSQALNTFDLGQARGALVGKHAESGIPKTTLGDRLKVWKANVLDNAQSWIDGAWGQAANWRKRLPAELENRATVSDLLSHDLAGSMYEGNPVHGHLKMSAHHPYRGTEDVWKGHLFTDDLSGELVEAWTPTVKGEIEPSYGVIIVDGNGDFVLRMPSASEAGATHPEGTWNFSRSTAKTWTENGVLKGETPAQAAIRSAKEQMDLDVWLMDAMPGVSLKDAKGTVQPVRAGEGGAMYHVEDQDVFFYIAQIADPAPGTVSTVADTFSVATPATSDPETWRQVMTMFHHSHGTQMIDPAGVNVGGASPMWPDAWGLNMSPGAIRNRLVRDANHTYAFDVNVGMLGERVRTYGIPTHLNARSVAAARSQNIHAGQSTLDEGLAAFATDMVGPNKNKPYYRVDSHNLVADGDMTVDMFGRIHDYDSQMYEDLRIYFKKFYRTTHEPGVDPMWGINKDLARGVNNISVKMDLLDDLGRYNIPALDAMDYQTKALFVAHLENSGRMYSPAEWPVTGVLKIGDDVDAMEGVVVDFLARIDEGLNPIDAWAFKSELLSKPGLFPSDLQRARQQLAMSAGGEWPTGQAGIMPGVGKQPVLGRGEVLIPESPAAAAERVSSIPEGRGWKSLRKEGPESLGGSMRYERFIETYRRSMMMDGYTTAAWLNPEQFRLGKTVISDPQIGAFNAILIDPMAAGVTPRIVSYFDDVIGKGRAGVEDSGILNVDQFLIDYARRSDEQLLGSSFGKSQISPDDPIETLYERRVRAAFDLDGEGGAMQQLKAATASLEEAQKVMNEARLVKAAAKSETRAAKATKFRKGEPSKAAITKRALQILNADNLKTSPRVPDLKTDSLRNAFAGTDRQLRAQARADLLQQPTGAEGVSKIKELETLISQAQRKVTAAETANTILHRLGTVDKFGRSIPLEDLSTEIRNLKVSVGALMDSDAQQINLALKELDRGAEAAKWLRQVGEYGDDEIWFPLKRGFMKDKYLDFSFEAGFKPFGYSSQGPAEMVDAMTTISKYRGGRFWGYYDKVHNLVKGYLIMKPGFHMRNYFSAVFMNHLAGVEVQSYRQFQNAYWNYQYDRAVELGLKNRAASLENSLKKRLIFKKATPDDVGIIRQMDEAGILGGAQGQIGTEQVMAGGPGGNTKLKRALQAINPLSSRNAPLRLSKNTGMGVETYVRGVMGFDSLKAGNNVDVAFDRIMKFHFDYSDLSHFEAGVVKRLVPFYTWTRKNLPLMVEQIGSNPAVFNQYNIVKKNIEGDDPITDMVPPWMIRQGGIQLPFKYKGENMWILPDLPFKSPLEMLDPMLSLDSASPTERITAALSTMSTQLTPLVKGPMEWSFQRNMWKGYNFTGRYVRVPTIYTKIPGMMPALSVAQIAEKNVAGDWYMQDRDMHTLGMMVPVLSDIRRLIPTEERYQQRALSTWISWWAGLGLRTNTLDEQERTYQSYVQQMEDDRAKDYKRKAAGLKP